MNVALPVSGTPVAVSFDPAQTAERYAAERSRRVKKERLDQFQGLSDVLDLDGADPYATPITRDAIVEDVEVAVLGGGLGGLLAGAYLRREGISDFRIIEQGGDFGGTWYWNRYPGVQCDIESYVYLPLLEETGYIPTQRYADGAEILEHAQRIGRHYDLYPTALFQTNVTGVEWIDDADRWEVRTDRGDVVRARFVLRANGPFNKPQVPRVPGINEFQGKILHTSRWDYAYTGGTPAGDMSGLRDKRVAVVGTGATAIQAVPYVARDAKELIVVQRTPSVVGARNNRPTDPEWSAGLSEGWQTRRHLNYNSLISGHPQDVDLVADFFTYATEALTGQHLIDVPRDTLPVEDQMMLAGIADMALMVDIHERIDREVENPETAEALKPWFGFVCKRPCFNDDYLATFNRPNVRLVAAPTGIDGITATGLVVDGTEYDVDCIIFATGFETGSTTSDRYGYDLVGRDGLSMKEHFADGAKTLHGFFTHGFPNFIELGLSQNAYKLNFGYMLDRKARHAARMVAHARDNDIARFEAEQAAQDDWGATAKEAGMLRRAYFEGCTPGYYNGQGDIAKGFFADTYDGSEIDFWNMIEQWWESGAFPGLALVPAAVQAH
jgi:cyclohexanone monooxygenase